MFESIPVSLNIPFFIISMHWITKKKRDQAKFAPPLHESKSQGVHGIP